MATVLVDVRPPQYVYSSELQRIQVQRSAAHNKSNDSVSSQNQEWDENNPENPATVQAITDEVNQDEFSDARETANALMAEADLESSGYLGTQLNVFA